jgi:hypothetical protein
MKIWGSECHNVSSFLLLNDEQMRTFAINTHPKRAKNDFVATTASRRCLLSPLKRLRAERKKCPNFSVVHSTIESEKLVGRLVRKLNKSDDTFAT